MKRLAYVVSPMLVLGTLMLCNFCLPVSAQDALRERQGKISNVKEEEGKEITELTRSSASSREGKVAEFVSVTAGPVGEVYLVSGLNDYIKVDAARQIPYVYPSLLFDISASPRPRIVEKKDNKFTVENTSLDLEWRNVTVNVNAFCKDDKPCVCKDNKPCDDFIEILEVLPNKTSSGRKDSIPVQIAAALTDLSNASAPFFPASTFNEKVSAAGTGLSVLFRNLFPPETQTYFDAFMESKTSFGWNFRQDHQTAADTSILGLSRGIVLLKVSKAVKKIRIQSKIVSRWNDDLDKDPYNSPPSQVWDYELPAQKNNAIDYESLPNLEAFPALIPVGDVLNILHLVDDVHYKDLKETCDLNPADELDSVKKDSLNDHFVNMKDAAQKPVYTVTQVAKILEGYEDSIRKADIVKLICRYDFANCPTQDKKDTSGKKDKPSPIVLPTDLKLVGGNRYAERSSIEKFLGIEKKGKEDNKPGAK